MVKMASIVPQNYLEYTEEAEMHMALACFVGEPGYEKYTEFFKKHRRAGSFLILDNGVIEGAPMHIEAIVEKAHMIKANEIVLPDVYKDNKHTVEAVSVAMRYLLDTYGEYQWPFNIMVVPQGDSMEDWLDCAEQLINKWGRYFDTIGIPKHLIDTCQERDARLIALSNLQERITNINEWEIHLLGCWKTPLEVLMCAKASEQGIIPRIRSCDSAIPYVYARHGLRFSDDDRPDKEPIDFKKGCCSEIHLAYNIAAWNSIGDPHAERGIYFL